MSPPGKRRGVGHVTHDRKIIGDEANQARLVSSWKTLTARLAELAVTIPQQQQAVSLDISFSLTVRRYR
jgi:hypothetical protein